MSVHATTANAAYSATPAYMAMSGWLSMTTILTFRPVVVCRPASVCLWACSLSHFPGCCPGPHVPMALAMVCSVDSVDFAVGSASKTVLFFFFSRIYLYFFHPVSLMSAASRIRGTVMSLKILSRQRLEKDAILYRGMSGSINMEKRMKYTYTFIQTRFAYSLTYSEFEL